MLTESRLGLTKGIRECWVDKELVVVVCKILRFADLYSN